MSAPREGQRPLILRCLRTSGNVAPSSPGCPDGCPDPAWRPEGTPLRLPSFHLLPTRYNIPVLIHTATPGLDLKASARPRTPRVRALRPRRAHPPRRPTTATGPSRRSLPMRDAEDLALKQMTAIVERRRGSSPPGTSTSCPRARLPLPGPRQPPHGLPRPPPRTTKLLWSITDSDWSAPPTTLPRPHHPRRDRPRACPARPGAPLAGAPPQVRPRRRRFLRP
jgi:hypothetical protein